MRGVGWSSGVGQATNKHLLRTFSTPENRALTTYVHPDVAGLVGRDLKDFTVSQLLLAPVGRDETPAKIAVAKGQGLGISTWARFQKTKVIET